MKIPRLSAGRRFQPLALVAVLISLTAFILSLLLLLAGHKPGFMDDYSVLTLNTSRIGENLVQDLDNSIMALNSSNILDTLTKRSASVALDAAPVAVTAAPTAIVTIAQRDLDSIVGKLSSDAGAAKASAAAAADSVQSAVESKVTSVQSAVESKAGALESAAASNVAGAFAAIQTAIIEKINETYSDMIEEFGIQDFYDIHLMATCEGQYVYPNGTNMTAGVVATPPNGTYQRVDSCSKHSALDPLVIVRVLYEIGIFFTGVAVLLGIHGTVCFSRSVAVINMLASVPALLFLGLASAAAHGVAVGAAHLIDFVGGGIGIDGEAGQKFLAMTWAATILMLLELVLWAALFFVGERLFAGKGKKGKGAEEFPMK